MTSIPVNLAIEDELSEAVLRRLLAHSRRGYHIGTAYRRGGFGYLRRTVAGWNRAAKGVPFIVLTDLDKAECPQALIAEWLPSPKHPNLLLRIAVREVEAWLMSDRIGFAKYIGRRVDQLPDKPDSLPDAKRTLVDLARPTRFSDIRERLVPRTGSTAKQGPDYNACLCEFVARLWDVDAAASTSSSLMRTVTRLNAFQPEWTA